MLGVTVQRVQNILSERKVGIRDFDRVVRIISEREVGQAVAYYAASLAEVERLLREETRRRLHWKLYARHCAKLLSTVEWDPSLRLHVYRGPVEELRRFSQRAKPRSPRPGVVDTATGVQ